MHRRALLASATAWGMALAGCSSEPTTVKPMPPPLLPGSWSPVSAELGGRFYAVGNFHNRYLEVAADLSYEFDGDRGQITLLPSALPPYKLDIQGKQGPNAGRTILASYAMENEQMTICYQLARGGERPSMLASPEGTQILLIRYKRVVQLRG